MTIKTYKAIDVLTLFIADGGYEISLFPGTLVKRWASSAVGIVLSNCDGLVTVLFARPFEDLFVEVDE